MKLVLWVGSFLLNLFKMQLDLPGCGWESAALQLYPTYRSPLVFGLLLLLAQNEECQEPEMREASQGWEQTPRKRREREQGCQLGTPRCLLFGWLGSAHQARNLP